jgi:hypothetical protein
MTRNLEIPNSKDSDLTIKKDLKQPATQSTCYRGFTSIDQEMEREIAMQWFKSTSKTRCFHDVVSSESKSK